MAAQYGKAFFSADDDLPPLDAFRRLVLAEPALQVRLADCATPEDYLAAALNGASESGLAINAATLAAALRPDPLDLSRWETAPITLDRCPPPGWLPARSVASRDGPSFDWAWFGERPLTEPFYEDSVRRVSHSPFNRMFRTRTSLAALVASAAREPASRPAGLIFHMSRCGSTLLARMLMAVSGHVVASEPEPLDAVAQWARCGENPDRAGIAALRAIVAALAPRGRGDQRFFIKLDSWHILTLPLFRAAFPDVPWLFLYRDPVEVMVSQMAMPGIHTVPGLLPPQVFGIVNRDKMTRAAYCARILGRICEAALRHIDRGGGMLVNYRQLPQAGLDRIPAHFGFHPDQTALAAMRAAAGGHAKRPECAFIRDGDAKRELASDDVRAAVAAHLLPVYAQLEQLRSRGGGSAESKAGQAAL